MKRAIFATLLLHLFVSPIFAQQKFYWNPSANNNASDASNWSADSCQGITGTLPGSSDTIIFSNCAGSNSQCIININLSVNQIEMQSAYTDTVSISGANSLSFETGIFSGGVFLGNTGKISSNKKLIIEGTNFISTSDTLSISGDFNLSSGNFTHNNGTVFFEGNNLQRLTSNNVLLLYKVALYKTDLFVVIEKEISIAKQLDLVKGFIVSDSINTVTLQNGATVLNTSDTSFVRGTVKKIGNSTFKFPIGAGWKYKPVKITAPASVTDAFTAAYFSKNQNLGNEKDASLTYLSDCEYWNVTHPAGTSAVTVRIYWDPLTCDIDTLPTLRIARWNSSTLKWESTGAVTTSGDTLNGNFVTNTALSSFGNFVIAKSSPLPIVNAGSDIITCAGTRIKLGGNPTISGGTPPYNISWSPVLYIDSLSSLNPDLTVFNDADYIIKVIDADDATVYDTIHVKVNAAPQVNAGYDRFISFGSSTQLGSSNTATGGLPPYNYLWNPATAIDDYAIEKPISTPVSSSTYTLTVTDANGCKGNDAVNVLLNLPSLNTAGYFGLLAADSILFSSTTLLNTRIGSRKFVSENLGSTDTIVINSTMDSLAIVDLGNAIEKIKSIAGITIAAELGGDTLYSGSYKTDLKATLNGVLTLSGDAQSFFIFNLNDSLIVSDGAEIKLDGINRSQVFFRIGKEFIVNGNATLPSNFLAEKNIIGGTISNATLLSKGKIIADSGSFFPSVYEARISSVTRNDAADFLGFSSSNVLNPTGQFPSHLSDANVRLHLPMLNGRVLRFPQGGISKEWNSIDGWYINPAELIDTNSLPYAPSLACVEIQPVNKEDFDALPVDRFLELKYCLGGSDMQLLLPLNIFSNIDFQKNIIQHALDLNINVPYLELGNEFYLKAATCHNQQPEDYAINVNEYLNMVHSNPNFNGIKLGIVGSSWTTEETQEDDLACRRKSWNANLFPLLAGTKPGDAITFHIYPETGFASLGEASPFVKLEDIQPFFIKAFSTIDAFSNHELKTLSDYPDLDAWITEYNLTDKAYNIHGSWAHSLFLSILTLRMLEFEKIKFVTCQTFLNDAGRGMFFGTDLGFRLGQYWESIDTTLKTKPWALTASGISMKMIGDAMRYATNASMIEFVDAPQFENTEYTQLYGWTFDKEFGDKQSIILNLSPEPQTINISKLQTASAYEQVYCKNPLYYVTGKVWWPAPYNDYFNSAKRYYGDTISTPVNFDSVNVKIPDSTSVIILPPYSITRLYVLNKSAVWLRQSDNKVCAKDENSFDKVHASSAVNMYASGGATYQWAVGDQTNDQQTSVSVGSASPVVNGSLKVFDTEGNLIGEKNDISVGVLPLPPVQVTPSSFTNANSISSFTATATGAVNYNWNPTIGLSSISGNTITISPSFSTNYQVIGTDENYCSKIQKISTIITPSVSIHASNEGLKSSTIPATIIICAGEEITLTADGAADEYKWASSDGSVNSTSPSITFIPSGNILITLTSTDHLAGTQSTTSAFIKLEPDIAAAAPDLYACENSFVNVSISFNDASDNATYSWNDFNTDTLLYDTKDFTKPISDNTFKSSYNVVYFNGSEGEYVVSGSAKDPDALLCAGNLNSVFVNLHIKTQEEIIPPNNVCIINGGTVSLTASGGGNDYTWVGNELNKSIGATVEASPTQTSLYTVTSGNSGCCASAQCVVTVEKIVAACDGSPYCYSCNGKVISVSPNDELIYNYQWYENGILIPGETHGTYTVISSILNSIVETTLYCTVSKIDGSCAPGRTNDVLLTLNTSCNVPTTINNSQSKIESQISVYPNPSASDFIIEYALQNSNDENVTLQILDLFGKEIFGEEIKLVKGKFRKEFDHSLAEGIYLLRVCSTDGCLSKKLVIAH